jgi:hypothetical protein
VTSATEGILDELLDVAKAIGLMRSDGTIDTSWFEQPLQRIGRVFGDEGQRQALLDLLDAVLPPAPGVAPTGQRWYPLLAAATGPQRANAYLTIEPRPGETIVGLAGGLADTTGGGNPITGSLLLRAPLLRATPTAVAVVAGAPSHPLTIEARATTTLSVAAGDPIGLQAVRVSFAMAGSSVTTAIALEGLDLNDGSGPQAEVVLDPSDLDSAAVRVVVGLLRSLFEEAANDAALPAPLILLAQKLPALLGLDPATPAIDPVPLLDGPVALRAWFNKLTLGGAGAPVAAWLNELGDLLGAPATPTGSGTAEDPWTISINLDAGLALRLCCARVTAGDSATPVLRVGASVVGGSGASAVVEGRATLIEAPLNGTGAARVLPDVDVRVRAPANPANFLVGPNPGDPVRVRSLVGGLRWNGVELTPVIELNDVDFQNVHHRRVDLSDGQSIANAGMAALQAAITAALGGSNQAAALSALVGLQDPPGTVNWPAASRSSFAAFAANPLTEIARVHRTVLSDAANPWSAMLASLATVIGLPANVVGTGTEADPWRVEITRSGALAFYLAAWDAGGSDLRIGLRLEADQGGVAAAVSLELLSFDLPAAGPAAIRFMGGVHVMAGVSPLPDAIEAAGVSIQASALRLRLDWTAGSSMTGGAEVQNVTVSAGGTAVVVPAITFPPGPATAANPLAGFGINVGDAQELARLLLGRAAIAWGGMPGHALAGLFGLHRELTGIPAAAPLLTDGGATPFSNPLAALRAFLESVLTVVDADGVPVAASWLTWLAGLLGNALPTVLGRVPDVAIGGSGTYDDPWSLPVVGGNDVLLWLVPGPPGAWATASAAALDVAANANALVAALARLGPSDPLVADALRGRSRAALAEAIGVLAEHLTTSDGVVPVASQTPTGPGWTAGATVAAAHHRAPADPGVITQVQAQLNAWGPVPVLLVGPRFSDATQWNALLAAAGGGAPTHVDFRTPGLDPAGVDLTGLPAGTWYTADLRDDGGTEAAPIVAQIQRLVEQISAVNGNQPVAIVAHSTAAVAARRYAAAAGPRVAGLIAITAPLLGAPLTPIVDPALADAVRTVRTLVPGGLGAAELDAALAHLTAAIDGFLPSPNFAEPPVARPYPVGSFAGSTDTGLGGVPALAIPSRLGGDLVERLGTALSAAAAAAAGAAAIPTHAGVGWRTRLGGAVVPGDSVVADAFLRMDVGRIRLTSNAAVPEPARPATRADIRVRLARQGGWLAGSPTPFAGLGAAPIDVRVRRIELGLSIETDGAGGVDLTPSARVVDGAVRGVAVGGDISDPGFAAALGAAFRGASSPAPSAGGAVASAFAALEALGVAVPDGQGGVGLAADAVNAIAVDAAAFLGPRLRAALASADGLLGMVGPPAGPWTADLSGGLQLTLAVNPWRITVSTVADADGVSRLRVGGAVVDFDAGITLGAFTPHADLAVQAGRVTALFSHPTGRLRIEAPPWTDGIDLWPAPAADVVRAARDSVLPRLVLSSAVTAVLETVLGPGFLIGPIDAFLADPGRFLSGGGGSGGGGSGLDAARISSALQGIATAAGLPPGPGITLFNEVTVTVTSTGPDIRISVDKPAGSSILLPDVTLALTLDIDGERHVTPGGTATVNVPLGGGAPAWPAVAISVGVRPDGVRLALTPQGGTPITLLPRFGGFGQLAGNAAALLPSLLDELDQRIPASAIKTAVLNVATPLDLYDAGGGFAAHQTQIAALVQPGALAALGSRASAAVPQITALLNALTLPGNVTADGTIVVWTAPGIEVRGGWGTGGPEVRVRVANVTPPNSPVELSLTAGYAAGAPSFEAAAALQPPAGLGIPFNPAVRARFESGLSVMILPLGAAREAELSIGLAPVPAVRPSPAALAALVEAWVLPPALKLALDEATPLLTRPLWAGTTLANVLNAAGILTGSAAPLSLQSPLPALDRIPGLLLQNLALQPGANEIDIGPDLTLSVVAGGSPSRIGIQVKGSLELDAGPLTVRILFGGDGTWNGGVDKGVTLFLFRVDSDALVLDPRLQVVGVGLGFSGNDGAALIDTALVKLGAVDAHFFAQVDSAGVTNVGAGVVLEGVGLPFALLGGPGQGAGNPVAASLLGGAPGGDGGDSRAVNPAVNAAVHYKAGRLGVELDGGAGPVRIPVQRSFGPLYIAEVNVGVREAAGGPFIDVTVDGAVYVGPLLAQVDDLGVSIPLPRIHRPDQWTLDLRGLAVAFNRPPVAIAGGLVKYPGPPIQYNGMLQVQITNLGTSAVGSYARPSDEAGSYTSLFVFAALSYPIGGPPYLFITGLGGGFGYNRELRPPQEITEVPGFFLVAAIDNNALANNPMGALAQIGPRVPPKRGALWLAAGLRFTTFAVVNTTAVAYAALDRGFELGVLGVSRMALPDADAAVVSVELALKARFSSEEALLSVQAQLTDNSWLFTRDCQLTGGFAFFMWFRESQFVLTLGGYHPSFQKPDRFPVVPRLGFRWRVGDNLLIKGEAYFALTNSCVMLGGRLEAAFEAGPVRAWFIAYADLLIAWDPFHYEADIGVSVGVDFTARICFFGCVTIRVRVSVGARLDLAGPPLHGTVTIEYWVLSLTIPFGSAPAQRESLLWHQFRDKYLISGDPSGKATNARVVAGLLPPDPPGAAAAAGTSAEPWKVGAEYTFQIETRLAAERWVDFVSAIQHSHSRVGDLDIAPMGSRVVTTILRLSLATSNGNAVVIDPDRWIVTPLIRPVPEATWRYYDDAPAAARNVEAIMGLGVRGVAESRNRSALIPIMTLVDDIPSESRPLPFTAATDEQLVIRLKEFGAAADAVAALSKDADSPAMVGLASHLLSDRSAPLMRARMDAGLPDQPVPTFEVASIRRRSAPPLVTPLGAGLTMNEVGRPKPVDIERPTAEPVVLEQPRLRAVLRDRPAPVPVAPPAAPTGVARVAAAKDAPRMAPPVPPALTGARLRRIPSPTAPRPTEAAVATRTVRTPEAGMPVGPRELAMLRDAGNALMSDGTTVPAGTTQVWDLPGDWAGAVVRISGDPTNSAARVACLSRTGAMLAESWSADGQATMEVPDRTATMVVSCTGRGAPSGPTGWAAASTLAQVGGATLACRGGWLRLSRPADSRRRGQRAAAAMVRACEAVGSRAVETTLPLGTQAVVVLLDLADQNAADRGDLRIGVTGARVSEPVQVDSPRQRALLYNVVRVNDEAAALTVAVTSTSGWLVAGTVGLPGRAGEWAARFSEGVPDDLVPDGPSTPDGSIAVTMSPPPPPDEDEEV